MQQIHPIPPLFCSTSKVLILGSFPSVKSREQAFFLRAQSKSFLESNCSGLQLPRSCYNTGKEILSPFPWACPVGCDCAM